MSDRHPKRSRCRMCFGTTRVAETWIKLLVRRRKLRLWVDGHAQLCPPCRESWLEPFQLELWPELDQVVDELPAIAPVVKRLGGRPGDVFEGTPALTASWPRTSLRALRDSRLSALVR